MKKTLGPFILILLVLSCSKNPDNNTPLTVNPSSILLNSNINSTDSFNINYSGSWSIAIQQTGNWLTTNVSEGSGNLKIIIMSLERNTSGSVRNATIVITAKDNSAETRQINITQSPFVAESWNRLYGGEAGDVLIDVVRNNDGTFVSVGETWSTTSAFTHRGEGDMYIVKTTPDGEVIWQKAYGGSGGDGAKSIIAVSDGYLVAGSTRSPDGDVSHFSGYTDGWLIKIDTDGNLVWEKSFGDTQLDFFYRVLAGTNGEFLLAGWKNSQGWLLKMDAGGNIIWEKTYPAPNVGYVTSGYYLADGGFIVAGSFGGGPSGDPEGYNGGMDVRIFKINADGDIVWDKILGGNKEDAAFDVIASNDGGSIACGFTESSQSGDVGPTYGGFDMWVIKLNADGSVNWQRTYGSTSYDEANSIVALTDGSGYLLCGDTEGNDRDIAGIHGGRDGWFGKIDEGGNLKLQRPFGGSGDDHARKIVAAEAGYYLIAGSTTSKDGDISGNPGGADAWQFVIKDE